MHLFGKKFNNVFDMLAAANIVRMDQLLKKMAELPPEFKVQLEEAIGVTFGLIVAVEVRGMFIARAGEENIRQKLSERMEKIKDILELSRFTETMNHDAIRQKTEQVARQIAKLSKDMVLADRRDMLDSLAMVPQLAKITMLATIDIALTDHKISEEEAELLAELVEILHLNMEDFPKLQEAVQFHAAWSSGTQQQKLTGFTAESILSSHAQTPPPQQAVLPAPAEAVQEKKLISADKAWS